MAAQEGQLESLQLLIQHQALQQGGKTSEMLDGIGTQFIHLLVASGDDADVSSHHAVSSFNCNIFGTFPEKLTLR